VRGRHAALFGLVVACGGGGGLNDDTPPAQRTTIKWKLNQDVASGFPGDACIDLGVSMMHVVLSGPTDPPDMPKDDRCAMDQVVYTELPSGSYTVALTPLDAGGLPMVTAPVTQSFEVTGIGEITVNIPYTAWNRAYTGSFLFALTWGGQPCAAAVPPVMTQVLTLLIGGVPVTQTTSTGQMLDGSDPQPCVPSTNPSPQLVSGLPLGPAQITVEGVTNGGDTIEKQFDTFVGASTNNPTLTFDVPNLDAPMPDAAPPDAAPAPDAEIDATLQ
jgi:hypothetical protein